MNRTLETFAAQVRTDYQRTNLFSVMFATNPTTQAANLMQKYSNLEPNSVLSGDFTWAQSPSGTGLPRVINRNDPTTLSKTIIGAMTERVIQTLMGEFKVGKTILEFFGMGKSPESGLSIYAVKLPENRLGHEMDRTYNAPNIKITGREHDTLTISFRVAHDGMNYIAMQDWVNAVEDPVTGLKALPADVEADIQVNLHGRDGLPHTVAMVTGCIPVGVSSPELSYESDNTFAVFDVTFAYRTVQMSQISRAAAMNWIQGGINPNGPDIDLSPAPRI